MRTIVKIIISCLIIFGLSVYATKKTIDNSFEKIESSHSNITSPLDNSIYTEEV
jgi:hypothetical protein